MITNAKLQKVIECLECGGFGWDDWDTHWDNCGCEDEHCDECDEDLGWDDDPQQCESCDGSGYTEDIQLSLRTFLSRRIGKTSPDENETIRNFLLELVENERLTTFDVCEMIDTYHLSQ